MKFRKPYRTNIKILFALQQDIDTYAGNLIYVARMQVNVRDKPNKFFFSVLLHYFEKNLKKINFVLHGPFREGSLNFNFSMASITLNYGDTFASEAPSKFMIITFA